MPATQPVDLPDLRAMAGRAWLRVGWGLLAIVVSVSARLWLISGKKASWWQDSEDYLATSESAWWSLDLWGGPRPPGMPVLLKLVGGEGQELRFLRVQAVIAGLCWAVLAIEVARRFLGRRVRAVVGGCVLGLSLAAQITMWDRSVLSESLALSVMALALAMLLRFARRPTWVSAAAVVGALGLWMATRDTHAWVVLAGVVTGLIAWWAGLWRRDRRERRERDDQGDHGDQGEDGERYEPGAGDEPERSLLRAGPVFAGVAAVLAIAVLTMWSSAHGERSQFPLRNVYEVRVLPYPDRVEWFGDHGMPQAEAFVDGTRPPAERPGLSPVTYVAEGDPAFQEWSQWVESQGASAYMWWLVTHPWYLASEPLQDPERTFNNAEGDRSFYAAVDQRVVPLMEEIFLPSRPLAIVLAGLVIVLGLRRGLGRSPLFAVGAGTVLLALPHATLSWHSDGMEAARHLIVPVIQLHVGTLLLLAALAAYLLRRPETVAAPEPEVQAGSGGEAGEAERFEEAEVGEATS